MQATPTFRKDLGGEAESVSSKSDQGGAKEWDPTQFERTLNSPGNKTLEMRQNLAVYAKSQEKPLAGAANQSAVAMSVKSSEPGDNSPAFVRMTNYLNVDQEIEPHVSPTSLPVSQEKYTSEERKSACLTGQRGSEGTDGVTSNSGSYFRPQPMRPLAGLRQQTLKPLSKLSSSLSHQVIDEEEQEGTPKDAEPSSVAAKTF